MNTVPDHKMHHDIPMNRSMKKGMHHDVSTGKSGPKAKAKALSGAKKIGVSQHYGPGKLYNTQHEGKIGAERNRQAHIASILARHKEK